MDNDKVTLGQVLMLPEGQTAKGSDRWKKMEEKLGKEMGRIQWKASMPDVVAKIGKLLDIPISDGWITSWKKAKEVNKALQDSEKAPNDTIELELGDHTIKTTLHPYISVEIGKLVKQKIEFNVVLSCKLKGFILIIRGGAIREIATVECVADGTIDYDGLVLAKHELAPIRLPEKILVE
jgi:hypothetical protein